MVDNDLTITTAGAITTTSGTLTAPSGRILRLDGLVEIGTGTVFTGTGTLRLANTVTVSTPAIFPSGGPTIDLNTATAVTVNGPALLTNRGLMLLSADVIDAPFINEGRVIVQGSSTINGAFTNAGTPTVGLLQVATSINVAVTLTVANGMTNAGTIELTTLGGAGGSTQALNITTAAIVNQGTMDAESGTLTLAATATLDHQAGAFVQGNGTFDISSAASVTFNGFVVPGTNGTAGTLRIQGNLSMGATAGFIIDIAGTTQGTQYDHLIVNGVMTVNGTMQIVWDNTAFPSPTIGDSFQVATYNTGSSGSFPSGVTGRTIDGSTRQFSLPSINATNMVVSVVAFP